MRIARCIESSRRYCKWFLRIHNLFSLSFTAAFPDELEQPLLIPRTFQALGEHESQLPARYSKEALLRYVVKQLYLRLGLQSTYIIDIGAWIGDNSLVWSKMLEKAGINVLAIDPSISNINWIKKVALKNSIHNIVPIQALCSADVGSFYGLSKGSYNHGSFRRSSDASCGHVSTTLDTIAFGLNATKSVSLIHLDVEGLEFEVLQGSVEIISASHPIVIFESHIVSEHHTYLRCLDFLHGHEYIVYMINEILPGCRSDCRNFLAIPRTMSFHQPFIESLSCSNESYRYFPCLPTNASLLAVSRGLN